MARLPVILRCAAVKANWYSKKGVHLVSQITGLDEKTIRRGQSELAEDLVNRPNDRVRLAGAGRMFYWMQCVKQKLQLAWKYPQLLLTRAMKKGSLLVTKK